MDVPEADVEGCGDFATQETNRKRFLVSVLVVESLIIRKNADIQARTGPPDNWENAR